MQIAQDARHNCKRYALGSQWCVSFFSPSHSPSITVDLVGIGLGPRNSFAPVREGKTSRVIENTENTQTTPFVVTFPKHRERLVSLPVKRQAVVNSANTVFALKLLMDQKFQVEDMTHR